MTPSDRDPFERLGRLPDPKPDPQAMRATIAASRAAFAQQAARKPQTERARWRERLRGGFGNFSGWLVPAGVGAFGIIAAVAVLPSVLTHPTLQDGAPPPQAPGGAAMEREAPAMAEAPAEALPAAAPESDNATRFSAAPVPAPAPALAEAPQPADAEPAFEIHAEDDLRLGYRLADGHYRLYLLIDDNALAMDDREVDAETVAIRDAFRLTRPGEREIIAVETQFGSRAPVWSAYRFDGSGLSRDDARSAAIADAPNAAEAEARLTAFTGAD